MNIVDLMKNYDGKTVVNSVSFEIPKGKVLSMIGPNGAGKSTVMGMISRLIAKDSGVIDFEDKDLSKWKSKELAKKLSILTQHNNIQMKLTVRELVAFGRFPYSGNHLTAEDHEMIDKAIAYMELQEIEDRFIDELSGGQRQRAYIAMVIAQDTESQLNIIAKELGANNLGETIGEAEKATHGEEASWETIITLDPEYMFILDRSTATGGIQALDTMLADLEGALLNETF